MSNARLSSSGLVGTALNYAIDSENTLSDYIFNTATNYERTLNGAITYTANQFVVVKIKRTVNGSSTVSDTTPSAVNIINEMRSKHPRGANMPVNTGYKLIIEYISFNGSAPYSLTGGAGVTINGVNSVFRNRVVELTVIATNVSSGSEAVMVTWQTGLK
jgi:hypothetical protein